MNSIDLIKDNIRNLYKTHPKIYINVSMTSPRISLNNEVVVITGVYPHIFQIEESSSGLAKRHTLQYTDILTGQIQIVGLAE